MNKPFLNQYLSKEKQAYDKPDAFFRVVPHEFLWWSK